MLTNVTDRTEGQVLTDAAQAQLLEAAEAVRVSGVLGRSRLLIALFDFLVSRSADGRPPKESEIAYEVFGKPGGFETGQDAVVRVYIHRLRRKLEDYAAEADRAAGFHLTLPKGEYRIVGEAAARSETAGPDGAVAPARAPRLDRRWIAAALAALAVVNFGAWVTFSLPSDPVAAARHSPIWSPFIHSRFPLLVVVGDYYIFGESDDGLEVARLVREYDVGSPSDLNQFLVEHPEKAEHYMDLGLAYLPTSSAPAMADLAPLFAGRKPIRVITASALTPEMMKTYDVIYLGYISGLGSLRHAAFMDSRFDVGENFDEILDTATKRRYISQAALGPTQGDVYHDFGYASIFAGPDGNHIAIIAGQRDIGSMAVAEQLTRPDSLRTLKKAIGRTDSFEAVYEVTGQGETDFNPRLVIAVPRAPPKDWATDR